MILCFLLFCMKPSAESQDLSVKIGYFNAEPHIFIKPSTGHLTGAAYDLIENYIRPKTGIKFEWEKKPSTISRQISNLKRSDRFASILLVFVKQRLEFSIYSATPYFFSKPIIAVRKSNPLKEIYTVEDITPLLIGYAQNSYITPFMEHPKLRYDLIANPNYHSLNLKKMLKGRIDAVYAPGAGSIQFLLEKLDLLDEVRIVHLPEPPIPYHIVFSKDLKEVAQSFDRVFKEINGQEIYKRLLAKYIDTSKL